MGWYVFALADAVPGARHGRGLKGPLTARRVPGGVAIVERRADVPPVDFDTLKRHEAVVARVAATSPAVLPVRYGTLLEADEIDEALAGRGEEIREALEAVRDRVQFTWRTRGARGAQGARGARGARGALGAQGARGGQAAMTGAEYLRRAAANAVPPAAFRAIRDTLKPLVAGERYQPATLSLPDSLYHLVDRDRVDHYLRTARKLADASPALRVTGPFPVFAFTPELL